MAITPSEAIRLTDEEIEKIRSVESQIDAGLKNDFDGSNSVTVKLQGTPSIPRRVRERIIAMYCVRGWNTTISEPGQYRTTFEVSLRMHEGYPLSKDYIPPLGQASIRQAQEQAIEESEDRFGSIQ